uniref:Uncharacterized protein n=1 Tax=Manihot esculenta TaxID=3983 RepID=A0A2C9U268_MANES
MDRLKTHLEQYNLCVLLSLKALYFHWVYRFLVDKRGQNLTPLAGNLGVCFEALPQCGTQALFM